MSHPKVKEQSYSNVKGISQKTSVYTTEDGAVLNLENYDFQTPGAWSKRWGFTSAAINTTLSLGGRPVLDMITSFSNIYGLQNLAFTDTAPYIYTFQTKPGYTGYTNGMISYISANGLTPLYQSVSPMISTCVRNFQQYTFWTTGSTLYKFYTDTIVNGPTFRTGLYGLPPAGPIPPANGITLTGSGTGGGFSGSYQYYYGYRDNFGFIVPGVRPFSGYFGPVNLGSGTFTPSAGATVISIAGLPVPFTANDWNNAGSLYAARSLVIYRDRVPGYPSTEVVSISELAAGGTTTYFDTPSGGNLVGYPLPTHEQFQTTQIVIPDVSVSIRPMYVEVYQSRFFIGAKRSNTIYFSELQAPQVIEPENNFDITGNESDLMGMKTYNQSLIMGMRKGIFRLTGDNPGNFAVLELTKEYGVISNKSMVVWHERLWFLDQGQIVEFNGSNFMKVSDDVAAILGNVDYEAAEERASALHVENRNEVWFSVPVLGSNFNTVIVYDYYVGAWTTFKGIPATSLAMLYTSDTTSGGGLYTQKRPVYFFGSQGGTLAYFDKTFKRDSGANITLSFTTKYHQPLPKTAVSQFRRFWIDNGPLAGTTLTYKYAFYADYATLAPSLTTTFVTDKFQKRYEFGIPAKSLSVKVTHESGNLDHFVYGYTVESRFQRNV